MLTYVDQLFCLFESKNRKIVFLYMESGKVTNYSKGQCRIDSLLFKIYLDVLEHSRKIYVE